MIQLGRISQRVVDSQDVFCVQKARRYDMKKLFCEYPCVLYKTLIERMGDDQNSFSLILINC